MLGCSDPGKRVLIVTVEADALAGPLLARRAREAGISEERATKEIATSLAVK